MSLRSIHHVQLAMPKGREAEARSFYGELLGLTEVTKPANLAARGGVWFESGDLRVHLGVDRAFRAARKAHPAFLVDNLASVKEKCEAAGVEMIEDQPLAGYDRVYVYDPFGNRIEFLEQL